MGFLVISRRQFQQTVDRDRIIPSVHIGNTSRGKSSRHTELYFGRGVELGNGLHNHLERVSFGPPERMVMGDVIAIKTAISCF